MGYIVGEDQSSDIQQQTELPFPASDMVRALQITMAPYLYENSYEDASCYNQVETFNEAIGESGRSVIDYEKKGEGTCNQIRDKEAKEILHEALRKTDTLNDADAIVISVDDTAAVVFYEADTHTATITFATTQTLGDIYDNVVKSGPTEHALGGNVHRGFYEDLIEEGAEGARPANNMVELIEGLLHDRASRNDGQPLTVDFSGFCSAGGKTALAVGEMINNGLFDNSSNIQLGNIYTYASVGYADQTFIDNLESNVEQLGGNLWHVELHGDNLSNLMSPEGPWIADRGYEQAGTHIYIVAGQDGDTPQFSINPTQAEMDQFPKAGLTGIDAHRPEPYERVLTALDDKTKELEDTVTDNYVVPDRSIPENMLLGL